MNRLTCTDCGTGIQNGRAVIRSISFEQVATHKPGECPAVPVQRSALAERITLAQAS